MKGNAKSRIKRDARLRTRCPGPRPLVSDAASPEHMKEAIMSTQPQYSMRDPTAELSPVLRERQAPLTSLTHRKVALLSISKERSDEFLDAVADNLAARGIAFARFRKPTHTKPAPRAIIEDIIEQCDAVIEGLAD